MTKNIKETKSSYNFKKRAEYLKSLINDNRKWHLAKVNDNGTYTVDIDDNNVFTTAGLKEFVDTL